MPPVRMLRLLLHFGLPLAALGLWLSPVPVPGRIAPASAVEREGPATHDLSALHAASLVGSQSTPARSADGPPLAVVAVPHFAHDAAPKLTTARILPGVHIRARSAGPLYRVQRSGQAHRSAP